MIALTHRPSPQMEACQRTYVPYVPIDLAVAARQHEAYCLALTKCGAQVRVYEVNSGHPDCAFIEDTAVVLDEVAIVGSMGAASRRAEPAGIEPVLKEYRQVERIELPATLEGGDLLRIGRRLLVGNSGRTNAAGIERIQSLTAPLGYSVTAIPVTASLHLKTACTALPDGRLLVNPQWINLRSLADFEIAQVPASEPWGANICLIGECVVLPAAHVQTAERLAKLGFQVLPVDISEFAKAEGGVTCLSLLFQE